MTSNPGGTDMTMKWRGIGLVLVTAMFTACGGGGNGSDSGTDTDAEAGTEDAGDTDTESDLCDETTPGNPFAWTRVIGGDGDDVLGALAISPDGNVIAVGFFDSELLIFENGDVSSVDVYSGDGNAFIAQYAGDGSLEWVKQVGPPSGAIATAADVAVDGSVFVTGRFGSAETVIGAGEPNETVLSGSSEYGNIYIAKLGADGGLIWARAVDCATTTCVEEVYSVVSTPDGGAVIAGEFGMGPVVFGLGEPNETVFTTDVSICMQGFVARYAADGSFTWAREINGNGSEPLGAVDAFADGSIIVAGRFTGGPLVLGEGEANETTLTGDWDGDGFFAKYDSEGSLISARQTIGAGMETVRGVATNGESFYLFGNFGTSPITFDHGEPTELILEPAATISSFVASYSADGNVEWAQRYSCGDGGTQIKDADSAGTGAAVAGAVCLGLDGQPDESNWGAVLNVYGEDLQDQIAWVTSWGDIGVGAVAGAADGSFAFGGTARLDTAQVNSAACMVPLDHTYSLDIYIALVVP